MILERSVDALIQEPQNLQFRPLFVLCVDDVPGSRGTIRVLQISVINFQIFIIMLVFMEVVLIYAPAGVFVTGKDAEAFFLFLFAQLEEELHDQVTIVGQ